MKRELLTVAHTDSKLSACGQDILRKFLELHKLLPFLPPNAHCGIWRRKSRCCWRKSFNVLTAQIGCYNCTKTIICSHSLVHSLRVERHCAKKARMNFCSSVSKASLTLAPHCPSRVSGWMATNYTISARCEGLAGRVGGIRFLGRMRRQEEVDSRSS